MNNVLAMRAHQRADWRVCLRRKPKALGLEAQKAERRAYPTRKPKALGLANWMVA
jgi:hypothetical protein